MMGNESTSPLPPAHAGSVGHGAAPAPRPVDHRHPHSHATDDHCHHHHHQHDARRIARPDALVRGERLTLVRGGRAIVENVDIDISAGEIVTLIGPNGAGKTSLVRLLLGLVQPDAGTVVRRPGLVIGYAPQRLDVDETIPITVERFLRLGRRADAAKIASALAEVGAGALIERQLASLSGGELQRVVLARALLREPHLLVLDEPVRAVDFVGEAELYDLISRLRTSRHLGVLLVSHDLHVVMARSDRVICLNRHVCCQGGPARVALDPEYRRMFGARSADVIAPYHHHHDHGHDLDGRPVPLPGASGETAG